MVHINFMVHKEEKEEAQDPRWNTCRQVDWDSRGKSHCIDAPSKGLEMPNIDKIPKKQMPAY